MSVCWGMPCVETARCSFGKTPSKQPGRLSIPYSQIKQPCIHMSQARGDLVKRTAWLWAWAAGTTLKKTKRVPPMIRKRRNARDSLRRCK